MLVALGAPALIGAGGFAIDTAQWYMWKRELQHSVDQAAYAGAWALAREESADNWQTRAR
ncbi:MAG: pilus assembly protein TadG-related protein [Sphingomonadaceae bacterium]